MKLTIDGVDTSIALIHRLMKEKGIELANLNRFAFEVNPLITHINLANDSFMFQKMPFLHDYFNPYTGRLTYQKRDIGSALKMDNAKLVGLRRLLSSTPTAILFKNISSIPQSVIDADYDLDFFYRQYVNSFRHRNIRGLPLLNFLESCKHEIEDKIKRNTALYNLTEEEINDKYWYSEEDLTKVYGDLEKFAGMYVGEALAHVVKLLQTKQEERAYIYFLNHIYDSLAGGIDDMMWFEALEKSVKNNKFKLGLKES